MGRTGNLLCVRPCMIDVLLVSGEKGKTMKFDREEANPPYYV
ncbi:uncharacterized protein G2W53_031898 [Senna tora]|uniref:Uncharacterized protein n=1 Tax=Senna tora TaxID=362788 RepID=A0A834W686_9FABA|nr:uncharacterized protein G2W53_031898 [Senna tora]